MHLRTPSGELSLHLLRAVPSQGVQEQDLQVQIDARIASFTATGVGAWLERPDVGAFIRDLEALVRTFQGTATIGAMSPDDLTLQVSTVDSLGHFALRFSLGTVVHSRASTVPCALSGGLELELGQVEELLAWFHLAREPRNAE
jgi:hypothetical protein